LKVDLGRCQGKLSSRGRFILRSMSKILDGLLFAGPALAVLLGLLFAFASSSRIFARRPRQLALGVGIPILIAVIGALRLRSVEGDTSVLLAVIGIAVAACLVGFTGALGLGMLLRAAWQRITGRGVRRSYAVTGASGFASGFASSFMGRKSRRKGLPPGPRIRQK
jgi:hypothetical protein